MKDQNVNLIGQFLTALPKKYNDQHLDLIYRHGYLIGLLSEICDHDPKIRRWIKDKVDKAK